MQRKLKDRTQIRACARKRKMSRLARRRSQTETHHASQIDKASMNKLRG
jgi:hypothetical protein